jgi:hypothetical protein
MKATLWILGGTATIALCFAATPTHAAPSIGAISGFAPTAQEDLVVRDVHWRRRCWRHRGHWHCRRYVRRWYPDYYYGGYYPRRHYYRHRPGFAIYGPGFGLYVGPRHRRYGW